LARPGAALLAVILALSIVRGVAGSPADDLTTAVARAGVTTATASPDQFLRALAAILVRTKPKEVVWYVNAAVKLRPDLADGIVAMAFIARRPDIERADKQKACSEIEDIVQTAVLANRKAAGSIVRAALKVVPSARDCIIAAALAAAPEQMLAILSAANEPGFLAWLGLDLHTSNLTSLTMGTITPVEIIVARNVNSPEQPPSAE
jgi:hypothetical protein